MKGILSSILPKTECEELLKKNLVETDDKDDKKKKFDK